jgi:hypothetical protein
MAPVIALADPVLIVMAMAKPSQADPRTTGSLKAIATKAKAVHAAGNQPGTSPLIVRS